MGDAAARDAEPRRLRMKDLCELTGLSRQAIHFYVQQGLLPPGIKTGRNMAYYDASHLDRLQLIRRLQHERMLPLKAIKAVLDDDAAGFEPAQRQLLRDLRTRLAGSQLARPDLQRTVEVAPLCRQHELDPADVDKLAELGIISLIDGRIPEDDVWALEHWAAIRQAGFVSALGFEVADIAIYEEAITSLFAHERQVLLQRLAALPADQVAPMIERVLPLVHQFLARYHTAQVRNFFAALE
jgi:DNA-binding transcriptional MerR regulator